MQFTLKKRSQNRQSVATPTLWRFLGIARAYSFLYKINLAFSLYSSNSSNVNCLNILSYFDVCQTDVSKFYKLLILILKNTFKT